MTEESDNYREIPLKSGLAALVDEEDYGRISVHTWHATYREKMDSFYAVGRTSRKLGKQRSLYMHRVILGLEHGDGKYVDHINHNTLDNRKRNLRVVSNSQNMMNSSGPQCNNTTGVRGVHFVKRVGKYRVQVWADRKPYWGGYHSTLEGAKEAYRELAIQLHGEFSNVR